MKSLPFTNLLSAPMVIVNIKLLLPIFGVYLGGLIPCFGASELTDDYGKELVIAKTLEIGDTIDVALEGDHAFILGKGGLFVADISSPASPQIVANLPDLGKVRQIVVLNKIAYLTAREDGVYTVDVSDPEKPTLLCHYDPMELATGIAISGNLLFIAQRSFGIEIVDVSDPANPRYLSKIKTDEAQSVDVKDGYLYVGDWNTQLLTIIDIHNPREPKIISQGKLDGHGDGVYVRGDYAFASTGHHSRHKPGESPEVRKAREGLGHGLEIFNVSDPLQPRFISRIKFPKFYERGQDLWSAEIVGDYAFCADQHNGFFLVNIADLEHPRCIGHLRLPIDKRRNLPGHVAGVKTVDDYIYMTGTGGFYVIEAKGIAKRDPRAADTPPSIPAPQTPTATDFRLYKPGGQIHAVDFVDDIAVVAAGQDGLRVVKLWPEIKELAHHETESFAMSVSVHGSHVYVAEARGGFSIWQHQGDGQLTFVGRYRSKDSSGVRQTIKQVLVPPPGKYALLHVGFSRFEIVDVSDPANPTQVFTKAFGGLYGDQLCHGLLKDRYACVFGHVDGIHWFDLAASPPTFDGGKPKGRIQYIAGLVSTGDHVLLMAPNGYKILNRNVDTLAEIETIECSKDRFYGKARIFGERLYISSRERGRVRVIDISDIKKPVILKNYETTGTPGGVIEHRDSMIIPDGREGLRVYDHAK